ncbi:hypothetical protein HNP40_002972 [Mycobacteroides chelonae]|nr:hypothetical protein [Mycobacteroides chelonae]
MDKFTVDLGGLAGFKLDLQDIRSNFRSNASRMLPGVSVSGATGLMTVIEAALSRFQESVTSVQHADSTAFDYLGANLAAAGTKFDTNDQTSAKSMSLAASTVGGSSAAVASEDDSGLHRFGGLQLPGMSEVHDETFTLREAVISAIELVSIYDKPLDEAIGIRPAKDFLTPLVADWEVLRSIGKRIGLLGINDHFAAENLSGGAKWLLNTWSGETSQVFRERSTSQSRSMIDRSADMDAVAKIVENGGARLERLVYNQAVGVSSEILRPITIVGGTFPLGGWAGFLHKPMDEADRATLVSACSSLKNSAESRRTEISALVDRIASALNYSPGRTPPSYSSDEFEVPARVMADSKAMKYGFGDNTWWEDSLASVV